MRAHKNALRYCYLSTLQDWSEIEKLLRSTSAESLSQLKADLDRMIDKRLEEVQGPQKEAIIDALNA